MLPSCNNLAHSDVFACAPGFGDHSSLPEGGARTGRLVGVGVGGGLSAGRLLAVIHALHTMEHHQGARQQKEQRWEISDGEPMLVQRKG